MTCTVVIALMQSSSLSFFSFFSSSMIDLLINHVTFLTTQVFMINE